MPSVQSFVAQRSAALGTVFTAPVKISLAVLTCCELQRGVCRDRRGKNCGLRTRWPCSQPILPIILLPIIQIIRHPGHSTHEGRSAALAALASGHDGASFAEADGAAAPQLAGGGELGPKGWGFRSINHHLWLLQAEHEKTRRKAQLVDLQKPAPSSPSERPPRPRLRRSAGSSLMRRPQRQRYRQEGT